MRLTVNGSSREYTGDPNQPLLWFLRDELGLTGTKFDAASRPVVRVRCMWMAHR